MLQISWTAAILVRLSKTSKIHVNSNDNTQYVILLLLVKSEMKFAKFVKNI